MPRAGDAARGLFLDGAFPRWSRLVLGGLAGEAALPKKKKSKSKKMILSCKCHDARGRLVYRCCGGYPVGGPVVGGSNGFELVEVGGDAALSNGFDVAGPVLIVAGASVSKGFIVSVPQFRR